MNLPDLATKMGDWLGVDTSRLPNTVRYDLINISMREICRDNDTLFNDSYTEEAVTAGTGIATYLFGVNSVPLAGTPWTTARPYAVSFWKSGETEASRQFLVEVSPERLDILFPDPTTTGDPTHFAVVRGSITLRPVPSVNITLRTEWSGVPTELTNDSPGISDENEFTRSHWEPIFFLSLIKASKYLLEEARIPVWQEEYDRSLAALLREHNRMTTGARRPASQEPG